MTHDYKRHGTTTLFAALNVLTGEVIGQCHGRHRHQEFLKFLQHLDRAFPPDLTLHVILDKLRDPQAQEGSQVAWPPARASNYTSRPPAPRGSTSSRVGFSKLTEQRLRRGVFCSVQETGGGHQGLPDPPQCRTEAVRVEHYTSMPSSRRSASVKSFLGHTTRTSLQFNFRGAAALPPTIARKIGRFLRAVGHSRQV